MLLPGIGTLEYVIIAAIALVVVGPKDLPMLMRKLGQFIAKARSMASDFRASFDDMARQSELEELRKEVEAMRAHADQTLSIENQGLSEHLSFDDNNAFAQTFDPYAETFSEPVVEAPVEPVAEAEAPPPVKRATRKPAAPKRKADTIVSDGKPATRSRRKASGVVT